MNETPVTPVVTAFLDANVLYPAMLRDLLMRLASRNIFRARWSERVHREWMAALIRDRPDFPTAKLQRTRYLMDAHFDDALVEGYEPLIETLTLPDADDRHVLAAAIHCGASVIVTANLRDFPAEALALHAIEARHPDSFILGLLSASPNEVIGTMRVLRLGLKNPPVTPAGLLAAMSRQGLAASALKFGEFMHAL
jgi:hypothetical protein